MRGRADALGFKLAGLHGAMKAAREAGLPRLFALEAEYEEHQLAAELRFVTALIVDIESGALGGLDMWKAFHTEGVIPEGVVFTYQPGTE